MYIYLLVFACHRLFAVGKHSNEVIELNHNKLLSLTIRVAARSKVLTVRTLGSRIRIPLRGIDMSCICVLLSCVGEGLTTGRFPVQVTVQDI
jgi:hypothetical protein